MPVPVEAGDGATHTALLTHGEQVDVLERLDFVLRNISELRKEVEELRNSLQHLAAEIIGEVRYRPCPFPWFSTVAHIYSIAMIEYVKFKMPKWKKRLSSFHWRYVLASSEVNVKLMFSQGCFFLMEY